MPLFGSRMVCETASYKYIEERDRKFAERENKLARWVREKSERKAALSDLKQRIRQASVASRNNSLVPEDPLPRSESQISVHMEDAPPAASSTPADAKRTPQTEEGQVAPLDSEEEDTTRMVCGSMGPAQKKGKTTVGCLSCSIM